MFSHLPVSVTPSRHYLRHLNFEVMECSELSCLLLSGPNIRCVCVCVSCSPTRFLAAMCHVLLRYVMPVKPQHGRYLQSATTLLMT